MKKKIPMPDHVKVTKAMLLLVFVLTCVLFAFELNKLLVHNEKNAPCVIQSYGVVVVDAKKSPDVLRMDLKTIHPLECQWVFKAYEASTFESTWKEHIQENQVDPCKSLSKDPYSKWVIKYLSKGREGFLTPDIASSPQGMPRECVNTTELFKQPKVLPKDVFSTFTYEKRCNGEPTDPPQTLSVPIEPLAGVLRHPEFLCHPYPGSGVRKDYIVLDGWATHHVMPAVYRKNFYFDLGASLWASGLGGASQAWFHGVYNDMCVNFDEIYAWEVTKTDPGLVFEQIPGKVKPKYHWYNIPASVTENDWNNPLTIILSETNPNDFVVLKIDIDMWSLEEELVRQILASPALQSRIDEMFWEHHADFFPMAETWGEERHVGFSMNDSINLFTEIRRKGIRVHSWV